MLANLYPIKNANGLLWYAIDYLRSAPNGILVLCRESHVLLIKKQLPHANVVACRGTSLAKYLLGAMLKRQWIVSFTPHPVPMHRRQFVVVHDDFPFLGKLGTLKRILFLISARSSGCKVGYINRSNALRFVESVNVAPGLRFFSPNRSPAIAALPRVPRPDTALTHIGLFGTDSPKKQYHQLFESARRSGVAHDYRFRALGADNAYMDDLRCAFPDIQLDVVDSDTVTMPEFLQEIDVAVSSSAGEGFGRPLAMALTLGIPTYLLESDTFREFFDGSAVFYPTMDELWKKLGANDHQYLTGNWRKMQQTINDAADAAAAEIWSSK